MFIHLLVRNWIRRVGTLYLLAILPGLARGQYIPVYGPPAVESGISGYSGLLNNAYVSDAGTAVGSPHLLSQRGFDQGLRAVRWNAFSSLELPGFGTGSAGFADIHAAGISASGAAAGHVPIYDLNQKFIGSVAVRWDATSGAATMLPALSVGTNGLGRADVNIVAPSGDMYGSSVIVDAQSPRGRAVPVHWDPAGTTITEMPMLPGSSGFFLIAKRSPSDVVVGTIGVKNAAATQSGSVAVRWDNFGAAVHELPHVYEDPNGLPHAIALSANSAGDTVGQESLQDAIGPDRGSRVIKWDRLTHAPTVLSPLTTANGFGYASPIRILDSGVIVGNSQKYVDDLYRGDRAVQWNSGETTPFELQVLAVDVDGSSTTVAKDVNSSGIIVGSAAVTFAPSGNYPRAVYWNPDGTIVDLNSLIDPTSNWYLTEAYSISDTGWIAGAGLFNPPNDGFPYAYPRPFLMQIPEPSLLLLVAAMSIPVWRLRRQ